MDQEQKAKEFEEQFRHVETGSSTDQERAALKAYAWQWFNRGWTRAFVNVATDIQNQHNELTRVIERESKP